MAGNEIEFISSALLGFLYLIPLIMYITSSLGLYKLAKKLGGKYPWLAFIPRIKVYTYITSAGYSFWRGFGKLLIHSIIAILFLFLLIIIYFGFIKTENVIMRDGNLFSIIGYILTFGFILFVLLRYFATFFIFKGIAQRVGKSYGTAILMTLFPWCMLLIVARRTPDMSAEVQTSSSVADASDISIEL